MFNIKMQKQQVMCQGDVPASPSERDWTLRFATCCHPMTEMHSSHYNCTCDYCSKTDSICAYII